MKKKILPLLLLLMIVSPGAYAERNSGPNNSDPYIFNFQKIGLYKFLKTTPEEFASKKKTFVEFGKEKGISEKQIIDFLTAKITAELENAYKTGQVDKEYYEQAKSKIRHDVTIIVNN